MHVGTKLSFNEYWSNPAFRDKRPIRNGSLVMLVGDNIYHNENGIWVQEDSHHSKPDGSPDLSNAKNDTATDAVLVSDCFYYFGTSAPEVPVAILDAMGYKNGRNHRRIPLPGVGSALVDWLTGNFMANRVIGDPFDLPDGASRYSVSTNRVTS
jgi:hypothetical protein